MTASSLQTDAVVERRLLQALAQNPNYVLDIDGSHLVRKDFCHEISRTVYDAIKAIAEADRSLERSQPVDAIVLEQKVRDLFPAYAERNQQTLARVTQEICAGDTLNMRDLKTAIVTVKRNSVRRQSRQLVQGLTKKIDTIETTDDILSHIETEVFQFTSTATAQSDIVIMGNQYGDYLLQKKQEKEAGRLQVGIKSPFQHYNDCIGGGFRNSTISVVAARAKAGKSWFALAIADHVARLGIPVLYMDTELEDNYQSDRRCAQHYGVPIRSLENMDFGHNTNWTKAVNQSITDFQQFPIYYVDIKGWSLDRQISIIRRFFAKYVGRRSDGRFKPGLVVLDYLKLMRPGEKGADKEWEALGYRMTLLHDLMGEYKNPMLAMAQQNRAGLESEDESTVAGSDRITWLCDSFSVLAKLDEAEVLLNQEQADQHENVTGEPIFVPNTKLKVVACRHGPGNQGKSYISMYFDIRDPRLQPDEVCGRIEEGPIRRTVDPSGKTGGHKS